MRQLQSKQTSYTVLAGQQSVFLNLNLDTLLAFLVEAYDL